MTAEEEVRAAWEVVHDTDYGVDIVTGSGRERFGGLHNRWISALAYTRQRQQEIAEIEEEIELTEADVRACESSIPSQLAGYRRILTRLQAQLTELKKGMKEQHNGK